MTVVLTYYAPAVHNPPMIRAELSDVGLFSSMARYGDLGIHAVIDLRRTFSRDRARARRGGDDRRVPGDGPPVRAALLARPVAPGRGAGLGGVHVVDEPGDLEAQTGAWARRPIDSLRERPAAAREPAAAARARA